MSYYRAPGGVPSRLGYPVYLIRQGYRGLDGLDKLHIWIATEDRFVRGCAGFLVTLTSSLSGVIRCYVTEESHREDPLPSEHVGFLYPSRVTMANACSWWPEEVARIDTTDTLEAVFWAMVRDLEEDGTFVRPEYFGRRH
ncbi:hypothetical protein NLG97_g6697 [Lecanicillium saksenae]|uniref:Uncharacterized protein n=1 Tax=Lecanicillium saksenae TaxID=468837 RepID=A0ACC1QRG7_9HYPO|nr:hypothetical protein NLG97_g6697 [Lecanicillium saksenae]